MGRIRTIKPEFHSHEELSSLPAETHLLAAALVNYADDYGYFNANPLLVKAGTNPLRHDTIKIEEQLSQLESIGYIVIRRDGAKCFGRIVTFEVHQKVSHPTESKLKPKFEGLRRNSGGTPETFRPEQGTGKGTGNREQGGEAGAGEPSTEPQPTPEDIVCAHPASVSRNLQPLQVTHALSAAVVDVLAGGEPPDALLAKVQAIARVVAEWPPGEMKFLSRTDRFFREREFNRPLAEWRLGKQDREVRWQPGLEPKPDAVPDTSAEDLAYFERKAQSNVSQRVAERNQ